MIYREYGRTGKKISAVGFGGMRFRREDYEDGNLEKCAAIVRRASELGVNYFDTAPGYCDDKSELIYGEAFKAMPNPFYVSTKCGLWNATDADGVRRVLEKSLKRLGLDRINFYNMWSIKTMDEYREMTKKGGIYEGALKAKEEGLIEHICFSTHLSGEDIAKVAADGLFEGVTLGLNAVNFKYRISGVKACAEAGMGVVVMNPLGGGLIPSHPDYFAFISRGTGLSLPVAALRFVIMLDGITAAIPGCSTIQEVEENVKATENLQKMTEEMLSSMGEKLSTELNMLCTGCRYCDKCPSGVPIPKLMDSYNESILSKGDMKAVTNRLSFHWGIKPDEAKKCVECGKCQPLCTQKLPIIERMREIARLA